MQKKIMILGASEAQLRLIRKAKQLKYFVIVCDNRPSLEGCKIASKYYNINYMNFEEVLKIARKEKIDGVISNSEVAMSVVSKLVDELNLPGNSLNSLNFFLSKDNFRELQKKIGLFYAKGKTYKSIDEIKNDVDSFNFPIIIKPEECSGSRGVTKLEDRNIDSLISAFNICSKLSRTSRVRIEEFIPMPSNQVINAEVFFCQDMTFFGWYGGLRSIKYPMIPMTKILPPIISSSKLAILEQDISKVIHAANISMGEFNVEAFFTDDGRPFIIEINPRQAGDLIPEIIEENTGIDYSKLLITLSVNDRSYLDKVINKKPENKYHLLHVVFPNKSGKFKGIEISEKIQAFIKWKNVKLPLDSQVNKTTDASSAIGYINLEIDSRENQKLIINEIEQLIYPVIV